MDTTLGKSALASAKLDKHNIRTLTAFAIGASIAPNLWAASSFQPTLVVAETYMDNIRLTDTRRPGAAKDGDFITQINPGFSWVNEGSRFSAQADYELQNIIYADNSDHNNTNHQLDFVSNTVLAENLFYLDADINYGQWDISFDRPSSGDNLAITNNRTDVLRTRINPYLLRQLSNHHTVSAGYTAWRSDDSRQITHANSYFANFNSHDHEKLNWSIGYFNQSNDNNQNQNESTFERVFASASYTLTTQVSLDLGAGYEDNELTFSETEENDVDEGDANNPDAPAGDSAPELNETKGQFWNAGLTWRPNSTDTLSANFGERYYGKSYSLFTRIVRNRYQFRARYEEITTINSYLYFSPSDVMVDINTGNLFILGTLEEAEQEILLKRLFSTLEYNALRTRFGISATRERQELLRERGLTEIQRIQLNIAHDLSRSLTGSASIERTWNTSEINDRDNTDNRFRLRLTKQLGKQTTSELAYQHFSRDSDTLGNDYENNSITASLKMKFM